MEALTKLALRSQRSRMKMCCAETHRLLSGYALFGVEESPCSVTRVLVDFAAMKHCWVPVRYKQPKPGPTTRKVLTLENTASWRRQVDVPEEKKKRQAFDIVVRKTTGQMSRALVNAVLPLPNVKEEIFAACDTWLAWELEFPLIAVKRALVLLRNMRQWQRIIQVTKWMLSKGHGFTMGTYELLIRALNSEGRLEEAEEVWYTLVMKREESVPRMMYARMIWIYEKRGLPDKALKMFKELELSGMKPDIGTLLRVGGIYEKLGFTNKTAELIEKYQEDPKPRRLKWKRSKPKFAIKRPGAKDKLVITE